MAQGKHEGQKALKLTVRLYGEDREMIESLACRHDVSHADVIVVLIEAVRTERKWRTEAITKRLKPVFEALEKLRAQVG